MEQGHQPVNFNDPDPTTRAIERLLGFLALLCLVVFLIALTSCACDPQAEYCGEPFPNAAPGR